MAYINSNLEREFEIAGYKLEEIDNHFEELAIINKAAKGISYKQVRDVVVKNLKIMYPCYQKYNDSFLINDVHKTIKSILLMKDTESYYIVICGILELFFEQYEIYDYLINKEYNLREEANMIGSSLGLYRSAIPRSNN